MPVPAGALQDRWSAYWSRWADEYDEHQAYRLALPGEREAWTRVWTDVLPAGTHSMLDIGTGSGNTALLLAGAGFEVTGIDLATGMLERARAKGAEHPHPPTFLYGDAVDPPLMAGSVDAIVSRYLLWTLREAPAALSRWFELLRPGGVLVAVDALWFTPDEPLPRATERQQHFATAYDAEAFAQLPFGTAHAERIVAEWQAAGFQDVRADPLPELLELDRAHGVAPGHSPQLQHRFVGRRAG